MGVGASLVAAVVRLRDRSGLFAIGALLTILDLGALLVGGAVVLAALGARVGPIALVLVAALLVHAGALTVVRPLFLPAVRAFADSEQPSRGTGPRAAVETLRATWRRSYHDGFVAGGVGRAVALAGAFVGTIFLLAVALVLGTALEGGLYALGVLGTPDASLIVDVVLVLPLVALVVALGLTGFAELFVVDGGSPTTAWLESVRRARTRPLSLAGYALVRTVLVAAPLAIWYGVYRLQADPAPPLWLPAVVVLGTAIPARALDEAFRVVYYERTLASDEPVVQATHLRGILPRPGRPSVRVALAAVVVLAAVVGAGAIRVSDLRPNPEPGGPGQLDDGSAAALYERAAARSAAVSHNRTLTAVERTDGNVSGTRWQMVVDYPDREVLARLSRIEGERTVQTSRLYYSDGTRLRGGNADTWSDPPAEVLAPVDAWRVLERNESTVLLGIDDRATLASLDAFASGDAIELSADSRARAWIAADDQRLSKIVVRGTERRYASAAKTEVERRVERSWVTTFDYENTDVSRPDGEPFDPGAVLWDALYY